MRWGALVVLATVGGCTDPVDPCAAGDAGTVCRLAGNGESAYNGDGLAAEKTELYLPSQVRRGPDGLVYVMDSNNMRLRRIEDDGTMKTIAGEGSHAGAIIGDLAVQSSLENPVDFDFLPDGRIVFVSSHDPRVLMIDNDGTLVLVAGSVPGDIGNEGDRGPATFARFIEPSGIAVGPDGAIYIADPTANRVRVVRDGIVNTVAGTGLAGYAGDGGLATSAELNQPSALDVDAAGNLYISDTANCAIRKVAPDGTISTAVGAGYRGFSGDGGPAWAATLSHPQGVAVADDGRIFVGDRFNSRIRMVGTDGIITTIAGTGTKGLTGDGSTALKAEFGYLARITIDTDGGLLIADQTNNSVRKVIGPL